MRRQVFSSCGRGAIPDQREWPPQTVDGVRLWAVNLARPLLALVSSWGALLLLRSLDRAGKGLRSAPRDALLADSAHSRNTWFAYGFHRAMDNAGALGGTLLAVAAWSWLDWSVSEVILWSALPGVLVLLVLIVGVREAPHLEAQQKLQAPLAWGRAVAQHAPLSLGAGAVHLCARLGELHPCCAATSWA